MKAKKEKKKAVSEIIIKSIEFDGVVPHFGWNMVPSKEDNISGFGDLFHKLKDCLEIGIGFKFKF